MDVIGQARVTAYVVEDDTWLSDAVLIDIWSPDEILPAWLAVSEYWGDLLGTAQQVAQDGDYFKQALSSDAIDLVVDTVFNMVNFLGDTVVRGFARNATDFVAPGWRDVLPDEWALSRELTNLLQAEDTTGFMREYFTEFFKFVARKDLPRFVSKEATKAYWRDLMQQQRPFQDHVYPALDQQTSRYADELSREAIRLGTQRLSTSEAAIWHDDLQKRGLAHHAMMAALEHTATTLHYAQIAHEAQNTWFTRIGEFLLKAGVKYTAFALADGPGLVVASASVVVWDAVSGANKVANDVRQVILANSLLSRSFWVATTIYQNDKAALELLRTRTLPTPASATINDTLIEDYSYGRPRFGLFWAEESAESRVPITNTGSVVTTYVAEALYHARDHVWEIGTNELAEGVLRDLAPDASASLILPYKTPNVGHSPEKGSIVQIHVLGKTDSGLYLAQQFDHTWNPTRVVSGGMTAGTALAVAQAPLDELPVVSNPLRSLVIADSDTGHYTPALVVENPFTMTLSAALTQTLPVSATLLDVGIGTWFGDSLIWQDIIPPGETHLFTYTIAYSGTVGSQAQLPSPQLLMRDDTTGAVELFDTEGGQFTVLGPLRAQASLPMQLVANAPNTIPVTVTNALTTTAVSGDLVLTLTDPDGNETEVGRTPVTVDPSATSAFTVTAAPPTTGDYMLSVAADYGTQGQEIFAWQPAHVDGVAVTGITPPQTIFGNATTVTIQGAGFNAGLSARLGDTDLQNVQVIDETTMTANVPAVLPPGTYTLTVTSDVDPVGELTHAFKVVNPTPQVDAVEPSEVDTITPVVLTINGAGFADQPDLPWVKLGTRFLTDVGYISSTSITVTVPAGFPTGVYTLTVSNAGPNWPSVGLTRAVTVTGMAGALCAYNGPGSVSIGTIQAMANLWRARPDDENYDQRADLDRNNIINVRDVQFTARWWGTICP